MAANTLSILTPSVNCLSARVLVRAAGLDFEEVDVWGRKDEPPFVAKDPAKLTPMFEDEGLPHGSMWESCAIMQYVCDKHGLDHLYPTDLGERAMANSALFYLTGIFYPLVAKATYPTLGFPLYAGDAATLDVSDDVKAQAQQDAIDGLAMPLEAFRTFFLRGRFAGGDAPSIVDIRWAVTLEFLRAIDYAFPDWAEEYLSAVESALGEAYSEPAGDVRGFIASVRAPQGA
jgi:glutathione S-transferase